MKRITLLLISALLMLSACRSPIAVPHDTDSDATSDESADTRGEYACFAETQIVGVAEDRGHFPLFAMIPEEDIYICTA
jgi:hypothetical protein